MTLAIPPSQLAQDAEVARLQKCGATFRRGITETPVCRFAIVLDPDGSEVIIHRRKLSA
jgi:hypothetical protein